MRDQQRVVEGQHLDPVCIDRRDPGVEILAVVDAVARDRREAPTATTHPSSGRSCPPPPVRRRPRSGCPRCSESGSAPTSGASDTSRRPARSPAGSCPVFSKRGHVIRLIGDPVVVAGPARGQQVVAHAGCRSGMPGKAPAPTGAESSRLRPSESSNSRATKQPGPPVPPIAGRSNHLGRKARLQTIALPAADNARTCPSRPIPTSSQRCRIRSPPVSCTVLRKSFYKPICLATVFC